jgi:signal transduction histidine kinase
MLTRLDRNKKELKNYILSLENANSELKSAQTEIIRSEKLASVGRLSAGIAHEIGNPLGIILGYLELIKKDDIPDCDKGDFLQRIEAEITRINVIIRQLLDFSRPSRGVKERVDVHELIINTLEILKPQSMMENIEVSLSLNAPEQALITDSNQLQQVFLNIMMNAADAMSHKETMDDRESGKLLIETKNSEDKIVIIFADNGPGIAQEDISKIFDPFYTTKEPGLGTGLGLSVCYRIVDDLEGDIRAESSTGKGMTIIVTLPLEGPLKIRSINYIETGER